MRGRYRVGGEIVMMDMIGAPSLVAVAKSKTSDERAAEGVNGPDYDPNGEIIPAPVVGSCEFCGRTAQLAKHPAALAQACPTCRNKEFPGESTFGAPAYADEQPEAIIRRRRDARG